ncbi:hypothetical protein OAB57_01695 [Bacteriovoracaceae bacterium]|nr:hypothetical protein [Bacteriovoracaceae bacterium]
MKVQQKQHQLLKSAKIERAPLEDLRASKTTENVNSDYKVQLYSKKRAWDYVAPASPYDNIKPIVGDTKSYLGYGKN